MSPFELNKIAGATLFAGLVATIAWIISANIYHTDSHHGSVAYAVPTAEEEEGDESAAASAEEDSAEKVTAVAIEDLLAGADAAKGKKLFKKCGSCHTSNADGKNKVGPNLWNIIGRDIGSLEGFKYSDAMLSQGGTWSLAALNEFFTNPKATVPGTKMAFSGVKKDGDRANLIAFLQSIGE